MNNEKHPIIAQLHNADGDRVRAKILLACPDAVLLEHAHVFRAALTGFAAGAAYVELRVALMHAVRDDKGQKPGGPSLALATLQAELAAFAAGAASSASRAAGAPAGPSDGLAACTAAAKPPPPLDI